MGRTRTGQDIETLKRMAQLYPAHRIAEITNRTVGGIIFKANELKISLRPVARLAIKCLARIRALPVSTGIAVTLSRTQFRSRRSA
jgi:hypothetical protein